MAELQTTFERVEKKYLLETKQYLDLRERLRDEGMKRDAYGEHTISNVYFDTEDYELIRRSLDKPIYKEKLRLRAYGRDVSDDSEAFVEIKKKYRGIVYKRRIVLPLREAGRALALRRMPESAGQIGREIDRFLLYWQPRPKVMIAYDREAFFSERDPSVRVTFDRFIRYRTEDLDLAQGSAGTLLLPKNTYLMELKLPMVMPLWLVHTLEACGVRSCSFSKYGQIYTKAIAAGVKEAAAERELLHA